MNLFAYASRPAERTLFASLFASVQLVEEASEIRAHPDALWVCAERDEGLVRARAGPDARVLPIRVDLHATVALAPWGPLAHDLRSPLGVVDGALSEVDTGPMVALARRGAQQLLHLAQCWGALAVERGPRSPCDVAEAIRRAHARYAELEPRRASRVLVQDLEPMAFETDRARLELALVRLFAHATRASRDTVRITTQPPRTLRLDGCAAMPDDLDDPALWHQRSRLATAVALSRPITEGWIVEGDRVSWTLADLTDLGVRERSGG